MLKLPMSGEKIPARYDFPFRRYGLLEFSKMASKMASEVTARVVKGLSPERVELGRWGLGFPDQLKNLRLKIF